MAYCNINYKNVAKNFKNSKLLQKRGQIWIKNGVTENGGMNNDIFPADKNYLSSSSANPYILSIPKIKLFNVEPYIKGELWYSYLGRLALCNGYKSILDFLYGFAYCEEFESLFSQYRPILGLDCNKPFFDIMKLANLEWMLEGTALRVYEPLYSDIAFGQLVYSYGWNKRNTSSRVFFRPNNLIQNLYVCPECMKEDEEFHYHTEHQLPMVTTCPKHGCALQKYIGEPFYELTERNFCETTPIDLAHQFSSFVSDLYNQDLQCTLPQTVATLKHRMEELCITELDIRSGAYPLGNLQPYIVSNITNERNPFITKRLRMISPEKMYPILMLLFGSAENFANATRERKPDDSEQTQFMKLIQKKGYKLLSDYRSDIVRLECPNCHREIAVMPKFFNSGWYCPNCDSEKDDKHLFMRIIDTILGDRYEVVGAQIKDWKSRTTILDKETGLEAKIAINDLFAYGLEGAALWEDNKQIRTETDDRHYTFDDLVPKVKELGDFSLKLAEKNDNQFRVLVHHNQCGNDFSLFWTNFKQAPYCRICGREMDNMPKEVIDSDPETKRNAIDDIIKAKQGEVIVNEDFWGVSDNKFVNRYLVELSKKGIIKRLGIGVFCNAGETHTIQEIFEAKCKKDNIVGCAVGDQFFLNLNLVSEAKKPMFCVPDHTNDTHIKVSKMIGYDKFEVYRYAGEITESNKLAVSFVLSVYASFCYKPTEQAEFLLLSALGKLREQGIDNQTILNTAKPLNKKTRLKVRELVYKEASNGNENIA